VSPALRSIFLAAALSGAAAALPAAVSTGSDPEAAAVASKAAPFVVEITTEKRVDNPFHVSLLHSVFESLFEIRDDRGVVAPHDAPLGLGVVVDPRGYVLTNEHVILRATRLGVMLPSGDLAAAEMIGTDPSSDLALLRLEGTSALTAAAFGRAADLSAGQRVFALLPSGASPRWFAAPGSLVALKRSVRAGERTMKGLLRTDVAVRAEASGGPLLNARGELIGITTAIHTDERSAGFAVPVDRARKVVEDLLRYGEVRMAWLGIDARSVAESMDEDGAQLPAGAAIRRIYPGSPAARAGLAEGDVIVSMGGEAIVERADLDAALRRVKSGDVVPLVAWRGALRREASVTAGLFPASLAEVWLDDQIGVVATDIPETLRRQSPLLPPDGVIVDRVRPRSPASATGLEEGDVLRQFNDLAVRDMESLRAAVVRGAGRGSLLLKVTRGRTSYYVTLALD
jgi:serine protease Do